MKKINKRLAEIEQHIKPGQVIYVWDLKGEFYVNSDGEKLKKEELPRGENVINIVIEAV